MSNTSDFKVKNGLSVGTSITAVGSLTTAGQTFPAADGSTGQYLKTDGSGALSWGTVSTSFNITDGTTTDTVGLTETVTFTGGTNITLAVTDNTVTINNDHVNSSDITENTNLFFTDARAIAAVQAAADLTIDGGTIYVDTSANRVGISDTSPQQTLDVAGNIGVNGTEVINASSQIVGAVLDSALTVGGSLAGVLSNLKVQYGTAYSGTPIQGSFFFDSLNQKLKVYTGSAFIDAVPAGSGGGGGGGATDANTTFRNYSYTLTGTTSAVSGADDNEITAGAFIVGHKYTITATGNTNFVTIGAANSNVGTAFTATGVGTGTGTAKQTLFYDTTSSSTRVVAYVNGIKQVYGSGRDFVATTGTSVAFTYNLGSGDTVDLQVYELLTNAAYYLKSETLATTAVNSNIATAVADYLPLAGGTMTGLLSIQADANARSIRIIGRSDDYGEMDFYENDNSTILARIQTHNTMFNIRAYSVPMNFQQGGNTKMTLLANGNVGIGTADPSALLHLKSTANSVGPSLIFENTNNAQTMNIDYWNNAGAVQSRISYLEGPAAWNFIPNTSSGASALYVAYDGNVGIGATANLTSKLTVNAPAASHTTGYQEDIAQFYTTQSPYTGRHYLNMFHDNNNRDGTTDHTVWGMGFGYDGNTRGGIQYDHKGQERLTLWSSYGDIHFKGNSVGAASKLAHQADTSIMVLRGNGNVGIGTDAPDRLLHLQKTRTGAISSGGGNTGSVVKLHLAAQFEAGYNSSATDFLGGLEFSSDDTSGSGLAGAGTRAAIRAPVLDAYNNVGLSFETGGTRAERMRIDHQGRVTTPYQPNFLARIPSGSVAITSNGWATFNFNSTALGWDRGSNFTGGTKRFTAPVAGIYFFQWLIQIEGITDAPTWYYAYPTVNGSGSFGTTNGMTAADQVEPVGSYHAMKGTQSLQLAANDYVEMRYYWDNGNGNLKGGGESMWAGHLIG